MLRTLWLALIGGCLAALSLLGALGARLDAAESTPTPALTRITVSGRIQAGSDGLELPVGAPVTLHVLRATTSESPPVLIQQLQTSLSAEGTFRFENLALQPDDLVFASLRYEGAQQASPIVKLEAPLRDFELPLPLYARTETGAVVEIVRAQHTFEFPNEEVAQILSAYVLRVEGDRFFSSEQLAPNGKRISARLPLPIGALAIAFDPTLSEWLAIGGTTVAPEVLLTRPLFPDQTYEVIFSYQLPMRGGATIDQDYLYRTQQVELRLPQDSSATLSNFAQPFRLSAEADDKSPYQVYEMEGTLRAGERLIFTLTRRLPFTPQPIASASAPEDTTWFALVVLGLVLIGAFGGAVWLLRGLLRR